LAFAKDKQQRRASENCSTPSPTTTTEVTEVAAAPPAKDFLGQWIVRINQGLDNAATISEVLKLYATATREISLERYRKSDTYGHLWVCYARLLQRTGSTGDDVRDMYKYMKSERIAQQLPYFFTARADFENTEGNVAKCRDILSMGKSCPPATQAAQDQEERFQKFLLSLKAAEPLADTAGTSMAQARPAIASVPAAATQSSVMQTPKSRPAPEGKTSTGKKSVKRFGGIGRPLRITKGPLNTVSEDTESSRRGGQHTAGLSEETTQVFFGNVSKTELRAQRKVATSGAAAHGVADTDLMPKVSKASLVRRREDTAAPSHQPTMVTSNSASATKRQRVVSPTATAFDEDDPTASTIVSFKEAKAPHSEDFIARAGPASQEDDVFVSDPTESTVVSFKAPPTTGAQVSKPRAKQVPVANLHTLDRPSVYVDGILYQKLSQIGKGGSSKVYKVIRGDEILALKEIDLSNADEAAIRGYENEIGLLQTLQGNAHIIKLVGWERKVDPAILFIVMECGDADLSTALKNRKSCGKAIDENCQRLYWQQMLEAVQAIHAVSIVHSDLKPANFLFVKGVLKLIDFGIATQVEEDHTSALRDTAVGTLNYMAPEAISNQAALPVRGAEKQKLRITPAADVWSLGCILYSLAFGRTPFQHLNPLQKLQAIVSPDFKIDYPKTKNRALLDALQHCLVRDPKKRPPISKLLTHKFLNPQSTATPVKPAAPGRMLQISEEDLEALLRKQASVGVGASPRTMSRRLMDELEFGSAPNRSPKKSSRLQKVESAQPPTKALAAPKAPLALLDPSALTIRRQALKKADSRKRAPLQPVGNDLASIIHRGVQNKFKNSAPADYDTTVTETAEWRTTEQV